MARLGWWLGCVVIAAACTPSTRVVEVRYPNGNVRSETEVRGTLPHGEITTYHPNGELRSHGRHVNGLRHGEFTFFDQQGNFLRREHYRDGELAFSTTEITQRAPETPTSPGFADRLRIPQPPVFSSTDFAGSASQLQTWLGVVIARPDPLARVEDDAPWAARLDIFGQYQRGRFGGYIQTAVTMLTYTDGDSRSLGKLYTDVGGIVAAERGPGRILGRLGLIVPLGNDTVDGFAASSLSADARATELAATLPRSMTVRASGSWSSGHGRLFVRVDGGIDGVFGVGGDDELSMVGGPTAFARINGAAGLGTRALALSLESSNTVRLKDPGLGDAGASTLALTLTLRLGELDPSIAVAMNGATLRGNFDALFVSFGITPFRTGAETR